MTTKARIQLVYEYLLDKPAGWRFHARDLYGIESLRELNLNQISAALVGLEDRGALRCIGRVGLEGGGVTNNYEWTNEQRQLTFIARRNVFCRTRSEGSATGRRQRVLQNRFATLSDELLYLAAKSEQHSAGRPHQGDSHKRSHRADVLLACAERAEALEQRIKELEAQLALRNEDTASTDWRSAFWGNPYARTEGWILYRFDDAWKIIKVGEVFETDAEAVAFVRARANEMHEAYYHDAWDLAGQP